MNTVALGMGVCVVYWFVIKVTKRRNEQKLPAVVTRNYNFSTGEMGAWRSGIQNHLHLYREFVASLCYVKLCLKTKQKGSEQYIVSICLLKNGRRWCLYVNTSIHASYDNFKNHRWFPRMFLCVLHFNTEIFRNVCHI